jgi:hypothetical protein
MGVTSPVQSRNAPVALTFTRYGGNRYFLSQVWLGRGNGGRAFRMGNVERELARKMLKPGTEAIAASIAAKVKH